MILSWTKFFLAGIFLTRNLVSSQSKGTEWLDGKDPTKCWLKRSQFTKDKYRLKVKGWNKIFHASSKQNNVGVATLTSDKIDFKLKIVTREKERRSLYSQYIKKMQQSYTHPTSEHLNILNKCYRSKSRNRQQYNNNKQLLIINCYYWLLLLKVNFNNPLFRIGRSSW